MTQGRSLIGLRREQLDQVRVWRCETQCVLIANIASAINNLANPKYLLSSNLALIVSTEVVVRVGFCAS